MIFQPTASAISTKILRIHVYTSYEANPEKKLAIRWPVYGQGVTDLYTANEPEHEKAITEPENLSPLECFIQLTRRRAKIIAQLSATDRLSILLTTSGPVEFSFTCKYFVIDGYFRLLLKFTILINMFYNNNFRFLITINAWIRISAA